MVSHHSKAVNIFKTNWNCSQMAQQKEKLLRISGQDGMKICKMLNIDLEFLNP